MLTKADHYGIVGALLVAVSKSYNLAELIPAKLKDNYVFAKTQQ